MPHAPSSPSPPGQFLTVTVTTTEDVGNAIAEVLLAQPRISDDIVYVAGMRNTTRMMREPSRSAKNVRDRPSNLHPHTSALRGARPRMVMRANMDRRNSGVDVQTRRSRLGAYFAAEHAPWKSSNEELA
ncbi:hypothetical protein B1790_09725 [Mycobacterium sp. AT1]|nr:hypothetical protein B1790_09725 [Mycobacterium sp. AT1]